MYMYICNVDCIACVVSYTVFTHRHIHVHILSPTANGDTNEDMEDMSDVMELDPNNDSAYDSFISIGQ